MNLWYEQKYISAHKSLNTKTFTINNIQIMIVLSYAYLGAQIPGSLLRYSARTQVTI